MTLRTLLARPGVQITDIVDHLKSLGPAERVREATDIGRRQQSLLWKLADKGAPLTPEDFVPADAAPLAPFPFEGQNSLPLFRTFRKVFYRQADGSIGGYNDSSVGPIVGPGYYILRFDDTGCYVDYTSLPTTAPAGWPAIVTNERGVSQLVYGFMKDYLRRVHDKVVIGRAYKRGRETPNYFMLARG